MNYKDGLQKLQLENLNNRRKAICLKFAKNCLINEKVSSMFPKYLSKHKMKKRKTPKFKVNMAKTERYKKSSIPYMVQLLNQDNENRKAVMK